MEYLLAGLLFLPIISSKTGMEYLLAGLLFIPIILGNTVSLSSTSGYVGDSLELTCTFIPTTSPTLHTVSWYLNSNPDSIQRDASTCTSAVAPGSYNISRYDFTCTGNTFKLKILSLQISDNNDCWSCSVSFSSANLATGKGSACISVTNEIKTSTNYMLLLLLLIIVLPLAIFMILICCGCLDCCRCCRDFDHYDENKWCYVTWYCLKRGCCSFFFCRSDSKRGKLFGGRKNKKERYQGCHSCQNKWGCGWPNVCQLKKDISCYSCYCICCVEGMPNQ
ncbi:hypothetical protein ACJMK2_027327, partial [Sinanodonta woodiana]